ncbi:Gfo/Idh/MocA family oxidoreductase [Leucobacter muris]|uniref:Gfo/Idh/MocA family oxidoreductase n=1 Tax=Leucobacter muris TaxID=1935379 RepID=A0ABX5QJA9_9MICO|nr:Gfo/Idh/MocA family oxidoreductase [Leucobacter muris]QAB19005.1 Gfo/Idh/MocA family oxidoreductase [Leucobacter muris]
MSARRSAASSPSAVRVAVAGLGWMGGLHARCYRRFAEAYPELDVSFSLAVAASRAESLREEAERRWGFERTVAAPGAAATAADVDLVSICTPNSEHADLAVSAANAGKAVWIEKPVGRTLEEVQRVHDAVQRNGTVLVVGHNYRSSPAVRELRTRIADGRIGTVEHVRGHYDAGFATDPAAPLTWRFSEAQAGGGASSDILSHLIDLAQYLNGPVAEVVGRLRTVHASRPLPAGTGGHFGGRALNEVGEVDNDDIAVTLASFANGSFGTLNASRVSRSGENALVIEIHGSLGYASWNSEHPNEFLWRDRTMSAVSKEYVDAGMPEYGRFLPGPGLGIGFDDVKLIELGELVKLLRGMPSEAATIDDALRVARVEDALRRSTASGSWIAVS